MVHVRINTFLAKLEAGWWQAGGRLEAGWVGLGWTGYWVSWPTHLNSPGWAGWSSPT